MTNTTIEPTPDTRAPTTTTELTDTTSQNYSSSVSSSAPTTNITSTIEQTTSDFSTSTTNNTNPEKLNPESDSSTGAIVGGCVGAFILIVIVIIVIIFLMRRRKQRKSVKKVPELPGKDFLESIHEVNAIKYHREHNVQEEDNQVAKQYVNLTPEGDTDEQTDPSVGNDGYLKKTKHFLNFGKPHHKKHKKRHHNGKKKTKAADGRSNGVGSNDLAIYTNELPENRKEPVARMNSVPYSEAPPPPRTTSEYATGRVPGNSDNQSNEQSVDSTLNEEYVNLSGQQKGEAVFSVSPTKTLGNKLTSSGERKKEHHNVSVTETQETDQPPKIYENLNSANYYNLKDNQQEALQRQSAYEDVGDELGQELQQDDVYENP